jgi:enoyl-CoA hydratase/carnithine racemase
MPTSPAPTLAAADLFKRENDDGVLTLTLNTPKNLNALSLNMLEALIAELDAIASDDQVRVIVLTGVGPALSAGHDLKEMQAHRNDCDRGRAYYVELFARCSALMQAIVALPKPVIAAIEGVATAAGCQLVAACDLAVAGEKARFGLSGVNFGLFCTTPLVAVGRSISRKRAMEMAMTGRLYGAAEAEHFGLVNRVVPEGRALEDAQALAKTIAQQSGPTLAIGKRAFYDQIERPLDEAYSVASVAMIDNLAEPDCVEGMSAFLEKRRPTWGRDAGDRKQTTANRNAAQSRDA